MDRNRPQSITRKETGTPVPTEAARRTNLREENEFYRLSPDERLTVQALQATAAGWRKEHEQIDPETGEYRVRYTAPEGVYRMKFGFMQFDSAEHRWPSGHTGTILELDTDSREYKSIRGQFMARLRKRRPREFQPRNRLATAVHHLDKVMLSNLGYDVHGIDYFSKLSTLLRTGGPDCAGLSAIGGLLLRDLFQSAPEIWAGCRVEEIDGLDKPVTQGKDNIYHAWLRISDGRHVILYDPAQDRIQQYDLENLQIDPNDPFRQYALETNFIRYLPGEGTCINAPTTESVLQNITDEHGTTKMWQPHKYAFRSQLQGNIQAEVPLAQTEIELVNGNIENVFHPHMGDKSPRELRPLLELTRVG